ncbi:MAG: HEAT repeat domain-containing protein, partial [Candidatus Hydrogenedentes bacterium]|nr:HEAT repeat domain-containing protein [Candidatus Hydrogenedentota bacterium]
EAIGRIGGEKAATALFEGSLELPEGQGDALVKAMLLIADSLNKSSDAMALALYEEVFRADTEPVNKAAALKGIVAMRGASPTLTDFVLQQLDSDVPEVREAAGQTVRTLPGGSQATTLLAKGLSSLSVEGKILLIQALKDRGDKGAGAAILDAARAEDLQVRFAAVEALGKLGGADAVDMLATTALDSEDGEFAEAARKSLTQLSGPGVDEAIIERIGKSSTGEQSLLIALLAERNAQSALPFLMTLARSGDEAARIAAADALAVLSRGENVNELVELLIAQQGDAAQSALERAVIETAQRVMPAEKQADAVLMAAAAAGANGALKATLLNVAGSIGGAKALEGLRTASADADPAVRGAAIRALANWATPDALDDLKQIAETTDIADLRAIAVDGYIRQLRLTSDRSMDDTLARYEDAIALASSLDQKRQILAGLAEVHDARAIALVEKIGADEALKQ